MTRADLAPLARAARTLSDAAARYEAARAAVLGSLSDGGSGLAQDWAGTDDATARLGYLANLPNGTADVPPTRAQAIADREFALNRLETLFAGTDRARLDGTVLTLQDDPTVPPDALGELDDAIIACADAVPDLRRAFAELSRPDGPHVPAASGRFDPEDPEMTQANASLRTGATALVDAVSRLQGGAGTGGGAAGGSGLDGAFGAFDRLLGQRIGVTLGLPDLNGDAGRAQAPADLLSKLQAGLGRSVTRTVERGETRFRFDPIRARGALDPVGAAGAVGAQAVVLQTVRALRGPFVAALAALGSERHRGNWREADDLREAATRGFDRLITEAGNATGAFGPHVEVVTRQIAFDVLQLAALGDVIERSRLGGITLEDGDFDEDAKGEGPNPDWTFWNDVLEAGELRAVASLIVPPGSTGEVATRDPDLALLAPEANEAALVAALGHLRAAYLLMTRDSGAGAILGRVRAQNDALAATASELPAVLSAAGLSTGDQAATFVSTGSGPGREIELGRFLSWVEAAAIEDRVTLLRPDLAHADLRRILRVRRAQAEVADALADSDLPGIPANPYAAGRRELGDLRRQLGRVARDIERLLGEACTPRMASKTR